MKAKRVLVTRSANQASALADGLRAAGMEPVLVPVIEIVPPVSFASLDAVIASLDSLAWLVFTSANAVEVFALRVPRGIALPKIAVIGSATKRAVEAAGFSVTLMPEVAVAESLADALEKQILRRAQDDSTKKVRVAIVRAEEARDVLVERLSAAGAPVDIGVAYRNVVPMGSVELVRAFGRDGWPDAVTFTSGSSVRNLVGLLYEAGVVMPDGVRRVSIGPVTSAVMRELGIGPHAEAKEAGIAELVEAVGLALM